MGISEERNTKIEQYKTTNTYMEWVEKFTKKYKMFYDKEWMYQYKSLHAKDRSMVDDLELFYHIIKEWATKNYIEPGCDEYGLFYNIKYKGILYEIGFLELAYKMSWIRRVDQANTEVISFLEIMKDEMRTRAEEINESFRQLEEAIFKLREDGISVNVIKDSVIKSLDMYEKDTMDESEVRRIKK